MLKRWIRRYQMHRAESTVFAKMNPLNTSINPHDDKEASADLVVIAFNNPTLIEQQYRLLKKFFRPQFFYTVADNSTDREASRKLRSFCATSGTGYLRLPRTPYPGNPSKSHGFALTLTLNKYLRPRNARYFGFLDHDIFPAADFDLCPYLERQPCYGIHQSREERWYLWPGLCFFRGNDGPDTFMTVPGLDTGGAGWDGYYQKLPDGCCDFAPPQEPEAVHKLRNLEIPLDYFGCWVHLRNASNWKGDLDFQETLRRQMEVIATL